MNTRVRSTEVLERLRVALGGEWLAALGPSCTLHRESRVQFLRHAGWSTLPGRLAVA